ncbi:hypothetical protein ZWY2020_032648 [Hordeum vulgare]|nr:hypothetical protein ZWY2020_032648 [Hordeum vulgare]
MQHRLLHVPTRPPSAQPPSLRSATRPPRCSAPRAPARRLRLACASASVALTCTSALRPVSPGCRPAREPACAVDFSLIAKHCTRWSPQLPSTRRLIGVQWPDHRIRPRPARRPIRGRALPLASTGFCAVPAPSVRPCAAPAASTPSSLCAVPRVETDGHDAPSTAATPIFPSVAAVAAAHRADAI